MGLRSAAMHWVVDHWLVLAVGLAAAVPVIVSVVRALLDGWTPVWDDAIVATNSFDVFTTHSPLVGVSSDASVASVGRVFNAGPLVLWLLAVPVRLPRDWALPVTMGIVNTASIMGVVALARRRAGDVFMFATAVAVAVMCHSVPAEVLHSVLNPSVALLPFTLLLFLTWSLACGEYRLLPLTVFVASFVVQAHFSLAWPTVASLGVGLIGLVVHARGRRASAVFAGQRPRPWVIGGLAVALVCWSAPLLDQAIHRPGNLVRIAQTAMAHQQTVGLSSGWHALVRTIGIVPWWLRAPTSAAKGGRFWDLVVAPNAFATVICVLVLCGLLIVALLALRRRRLDVLAAVTIALLLEIAILYVTATTPARIILFLDYGLRWASPAGMFTWLILGWSLVTLAGSGQTVQSLRALVNRRRPALVSLIAVIITGLVATVTALDRRPDSFGWAYGPAHRITRLLIARLPRHDPVLVTGGPPFVGYALAASIVYQLRRSGYRVLVPPGAWGFSYKFGDYYSHLRPYSRALFVADNVLPRPRGGRVMATARLRGTSGLDGQGKPPPTAVTVSIIPPYLDTADAACPPAAPASLPGAGTSHLTIVRGHVAGIVEHSQSDGTYAEFCGWAANVSDHHVADSVLLVSGGHILRSVRPTINRPDVVRALGPVGERSGYSLRVPLARLERGSKNAKVQLLAIEHGVASPLSFNCDSGAHDFGC